jgi:ribosomal protein S18 acetylase RimI-like enzyme
MEHVRVKITKYNRSHQTWFEKLNRAWIEQYFWMEPIDFEVLNNPEEHIIRQGGFIFMAQYKKEIVGTVALKFVATGVYEFTKMAVDEKFQGLKIGKQLAEVAIEKVKEMKATKIILYSNTKLIPAISLYKKLGFKEIPVDGPYKRSDIKMELIISESIIKPQPKFSKGVLGLL